MAPVELVVDGLVHHSARGDALARHRHGSFIASHLMGGALALAAMPVHLALRGAPSAPEALAFAWLCMPVLIAMFLSRTGRFEAAHLFSALSFTGLVMSVAWWTGAVSSFVFAWLIVVPLEAALSGSKRVVLAALAIAFAGLAGLYGVEAFGWLPPPLAQPMSAPALFVGAATAIIYAGIVAVGLDAAHQAAARMAREEDRRYRLLADNVTDLITRHTRSGNVLFASPAARALAGTDPMALLGDGLFARVHVADRPAFLRAFSEAVSQGHMVAVEFRLRRGEAPTQSEWRWVEMHCRPAAEAGEMGAVELVAATRDIEERKCQEVALRAANEKAERANDAKSHFLATMSHELRTPLNAIIGFSEMMTLDDFERMGAGKRVEYATIINESGRHLLDVVNGILDMSKIESGLFEITLEPFQARPLIDSALAVMEHAATKAAIIFAVKIQDGAPEFCADRRACKQILLNLLSNAVKFTPSGGTVSVIVTYDEANVFLAVADTGIGIASDDVPRLGTPFVQAQTAYDRRFEGTGLGLSVVKGLAGLHGGDMTIASTLGKGTTVTVRLPREANAAPNTITPFPKRPDERADDTRRASVA